MGEWEEGINILREKRAKGPRQQGRDPAKERRRERKRKEAAPAVKKAKNETFEEALKAKDAWMAKEAACLGSISPNRDDDDEPLPKRRRLEDAGDE